MLRKITAHLAIILGGMCFVLFVIDAIKGGAMSFINNDIAKTFIAALSLLAIFNSIISLAGQTNEKRLAARLQPRRQSNSGIQHTVPAQPGYRTAAYNASNTARPSAVREAARPQSRSSYNRAPYQKR